MLAISLFNRCIFVLLFLLLIPSQVLNNFLIRKTETLKTNFLKNITEDVLNERSADTLLLLQRRYDFNCPLKNFNIEGFPVLRMDESNVVPVKLIYNSQAIAVVCMSGLADSILLSVLAKDLDRMRETRIIIWLESAMENVEECLNVVCDYARNYNFVNMVILHASPLLQKSIAAYRLQPFPDPTLERISTILIPPIFPVVWRNFRNKTALVKPSLFPPGSFLSKNKKSGELMFAGYMDILILEFVKKRNINLKLPRPLKELILLSERDKIDFVSSNNSDITMALQFWRPDMECSSFVDMSHQFIVIPCGKAIGIGDVYKSLKNFLLMILVVYLIISLVTTLVEAATCRIFHRRYRFSYGNLFVNLNAFRWVLGISSDVNRDRRSMPLHQIIVVMGIFSMIVCCFFNANLSTFLTKRPQDGIISNFKELKESRLPVTFDAEFREVVLQFFKGSDLNFSESQFVFVPIKKRFSMMLDQDTGYAYHIFDKFWEAIKKYQHNYKGIALCQTPGLNIFGALSSHAVLPPNSVYVEAMNDFIQWIHDLGFSKHWIRDSINKLFTYTDGKREHPNSTPLNIDDLIWVWYLLGFCYIASIIAFIGELCVKCWKKKRQPRLPFVV